MRDYLCLGNHHSRFDLEYVSAPCFEHFETQLNFYS